MKKAICRIFNVVFWISVIWVIFFVGLQVGGWKSRATINYLETGQEYLIDVAAKAIIARGVWQATAEHYGGICKWLIEDKPVYGDVDTSHMENCLILIGGGMNINEPNALIMNCEFMVWNMDWITSLEAVDPNELERIEL